MTDRHSDATGLSRRTVLRRAGGLGALAAGSAVLPGTASANEVSTVAFCGCSQVVVYGEGFDTDGTYIAVLYCGDLPDGELKCAELTGGDTRRNYEIEDEDCKIVGLIGTTFRKESGPSRDEIFTICNDQGPQRCAERVLEELQNDQDVVETTCTISTKCAEKKKNCDPGEVLKTFSNVELDCKSNPAESNITVRSGGCGPEDSGPPGGDPGPPNRDGDSGGDERGPPERGGGPPGQGGPP